jgi:hypothetical protein
LVRAIVDNDLEMMITIAMIATQTFEKEATKLLPSLIEANVVGAGKHYAKDATKNEGFRTAEFGVAFDVTNPAAEIWALQHSGALIKEISEETLAAIRNVMGYAFKTGIPPLAAARIIRDSIGLTILQQQAVWSFAEKAAAAKAGSLVRIGKQKFRVPKGGFTTARVEELTARYNQKKINFRSKAIARTETIAASNEGQHQLWRQAQDKGLLPQQLFMEWIATFGRRTCVICEGLHGTVAPFPNGYFPGGYPRPPAHTLCRCSTGISSAKKATVEQPTPIPTMQPKRVGPKPVTTPVPAPVTQETIEQLLDDALMLEMEDLDIPIKSLNNKIKNSQRSYLNELNKSDRYKNARNNYVGVGHHTINGALRDKPNLLGSLNVNSKKSLAGGTTSEGKVHQFVSSLDDAIKNAPAIPDDIVVYRGLDDIVPFKNLKEGQILEMHGFQSTSTEFRVSAETFSGEGGVVFKIKNPQGLWLENSLESELLLEHGSRFRVTGNIFQVFSEDFDSVIDVIELVQLH